ncbi:hypothetical protein D3C84_913870 [compost metagenome]
MSSNRTGRFSDEMASSGRRSRRACSPARAAARGRRSAGRRWSGKGRPAQRLARLTVRPCSLLSISSPSSSGSSTLCRCSLARPTCSMVVTATSPIEQVRHGFLLFISCWVDVLRFLLRSGPALRLGGRHCACAADRPWQPVPGTSRTPRCSAPRCNGGWR